MIKSQSIQSHPNDSHQSPMNIHVKRSKITMSTIGKNQYSNNDRWAKTIRLYHDCLICH